MPLNTLGVKQLNSKLNGEISHVFAKQYQTLVIQGHDTPVLDSYPWQKNQFAFRRER
jgi:hypothetical protein